MPLSLFLCTGASATAPWTTWPEDGLLVVKGGDMGDTGEVVGSGAVLDG